MQSRIRKILEILVNVMILLVLLQTFFEDFFILLNLPWEIRKKLIVSGFIFDLLFTIEFFARWYSALGHRKGLEYIIHEKGWIDFLASIPLLLLNSGPSTLALLFGAGSGAFVVGGFLNILKVVKTIRIARILRLLRVLKLFKNIKHTDSIMAQRHVAKITTIAISCFVFILFLGNFFWSIAGVPTADKIAQIDNQVRMKNVLDAWEDNRPLSRIGEADPSILIIKTAGTTRYTKMSNSEYSSIFGPVDYGYLKNGQIELFFDLRYLNILSSRENITYFIIIVALTFLYLFYYSPHFALTVTDPIHIMKKGFTDSSYNLEIKIPDRFRDDEVYGLSKAYNITFLPMKLKNQDQDSENMSGESDLKMDDVSDILKGI